jgi:hypothetical protein
MEFKGFWYKPKESDNKIAGVLKVNAFKSNSLELIGGFSNHPFDNFNLEDEEVLWGEAYDSNNHLRKITLFQCLSSGSVNLSANFPIIRFRCSTFIDGIHVESIAKKSCYKLTANLTSLYNWKNAGVLRNTYYSENENSIKTTKVKLEIDNSDLWEIPVKLDDKFTLSIFADYNFIPSRNLQECTAKQFTKVKIESSENESIDDFYTRLNLFMEFLSFATLTPIYINNLSIYALDNYQQLADGTKLYHASNLYYRYQGCDDTHTDSNMINHLFNHTDIQEEYGKILVKWFNLKSELAPIRSHLVDSIRPAKSFSSLNFLVVIQSLEGFHRRFIDAGNISLLNRLKFLVNEKFSEIEKLEVITEEDLIAAKNSRNYYSHFYTRESGNILDGVQLFELHQKFRILLICCVLNLIGFENEDINRLVKSNDNLIR